MKYIAITILVFICQVFGTNAQAEDYCYSWDCDSYSNTFSGQQRKSDGDTENDYGDKAKLKADSDVMKTSKLKAMNASKLKAPSTCDKHQKLGIKKDDNKKNTLVPDKNNDIPCVRLY